jgi:hypothetical protein
VGQIARKGQFVVQPSLIEVGRNLENMNDLVAVKLPPRAQARMFELFAKTIRGEIK